MTHDQERRIISECKHRETDRTGLYIMVFVLIVNTCGNPSKKDIREIVRKEIQTTNQKTQEQQTTEAP